jgi:hypothetical protein
MLPVINAFKAAHQLSDVTVVADAGMISEANQVALQAAGLSFVLGTRIPYLPDVVREWRDKHSGEAFPDGLTLTQPWPATSSEKARGIPDRVIYYQFRHDRARRALRGIDEQVRKAQRAVEGKVPVKRNRYIQLTGATKSVNRTLEAKTRALAGWKGYTTNLTTQSSAFVIDAYHRLWHIEKSFRMSKHDLQARPLYHHLRDSIEAHLSLNPPTELAEVVPEVVAISPGCGRAVAAGLGCQPVHGVSLGPSLGAWSGIGDVGCVGVLRRPLLAGPGGWRGMRCASALPRASVGAGAR